MLVRQLFDYETYTYTYLLGDTKNKVAAIIDPVDSQIDYYMQLLQEFGLELKAALDTHVHADHITALGSLRERTGTETYLGNPGDLDCADNPLQEGKDILIGDIKIEVLYTPGHTDDSYSFIVNDNGQQYAFTGDTLLIRGTGRTDFQNGNANTLYESLHKKLLKLDDTTIVYPGHDYKGWTQSTIGEERQYNPRLNICSKERFAEFMANLNLPNPKFMDVAVPANRSCGKN
ncbi:MAG: MBL fold metallo-hydrolase [Pseudomonadales bacterium]|nr:MBL fold metallo-hydrolase [Pseudomonadales bacterium]